MPEQYPLPKFHFQVEWGGTRLGFTEVTGLDVETTPIEYREGTQQEFNVIKFPGMQKYGNIMMKRGIFRDDNDFFEWWNTVSLDQIERRDVTISLLNEEHQPIYVWRLKNAWACKVQSTDLKSDDSNVAIETLEVCHEGLVMESVA